VSELGGDERPKLACLGENRESAAVDPATRLARHLDGSITNAASKAVPNEFASGVPGSSDLGRRRWVSQVSSPAFPVRPGSNPRPIAERTDGSDNCKLLGVGALGRGGLSSRTWRSESPLLERAVSAGLRVRFDFHPS